MKLLLLAIRSLSHFRLYTWINVIGLTLSLTCVIIISRYVYSELSTDHFNSKIDRLCFVTGEVPKIMPGFRFRDSEVFKYKEDAAIEKITVFSPGSDFITYDNREYEAKTLLVDSLFLQLTDFPVETGNRNTLFRNPAGIAVSRSFADLLFGKGSNPVGQQITFSNQMQGTIEGVIAAPSTKSSLPFDVMIPEAFGMNRFNIALLLLYPNTDIREMNKRWGDPVPVPGFNDNPDEMTVRFLPLRQLYFNDVVLKWDIFSQGNFRNVMVLLAAACLILLIGLFNYINIYTLIQQKRNREFGMKKVFGSGVHHIIGQLFIENFMLIGAALFFSWIFVELTGRLFLSFFGLSQVVNTSFDCLLSAGILLLLPLVVSVYPFLKYLATPSVAALRSSLLGGKPGVSRSVFLVFQYIVSIILIVVSLFFMKQLHYMLNADMGFRTTDIIKAHFLKHDFYRNSALDKDAQKEDEKNKLEQISQRMNESTLFNHWQYANAPNNLGRFRFRFKTDDGDFKECVVAYITNNYLQLYEFRLAEGRFWDATDGNTQPLPVIMNETAKNIFGITDMNQALLSPENMMLLVGEEPVRNPSLSCVGILRDFKIDHLSKSTPPIIFFNSEYGFTHHATLAASINPGKRAEAISFLQTLHDETIGGDFSYTFVEDEIAALYEEDRKIATIYSIFALIGIFICVIGLFGLSLFDIQQRYKEIAIRKVNGATTPVIMKLLLNKYIKLLLFSFIIAVPISRLALTKYLEGFAFKAPVSWWLFAIALLITAGISLLTLIWQIRKAAQTNPAEAIKTE